MTKLNEKRNAMARQYISQNYHEGSPAHDIATGIFIDAYDAAIAEVMPMMREMAETIRYVMNENDKVKGWDKLHDTWYAYQKMVGTRTINQADVKLNDELKALHKKYVGEK